jgi:hypothetical protein
MLGKKDFVVAYDIQGTLDSKWKKELTDSMKIFSALGCKIMVWSMADIDSIKDYCEAAKIVPDIMAEKLGCKIIPDIAFDDSMEFAFMCKHKGIKVITVK